MSHGRLAGLLHFFPTPVKFNVATAPVSLHQMGAFVLRRYVVQVQAE